MTSLQLQDLENLKSSSNTSLISLTLPKDYQINGFSSYLKKELSAATNIKSRI